MCPEKTFWGAQRASGGVDAQACMALEVSFDDVVERNVEKLKARYPGGEFDVHYSENRREGDL